MTVCFRDNIKATHPPNIHHISKRLLVLGKSYYLAQTMHFLFPAVIIGFAASMMFVSASEITTSPGESGTLSYDVLPGSRDQNNGYDSVDEYGHDTIKRLGRFARRGALMDVSGLSKRSEIREIGEISKSKSSDGVGHRELVGQKLPSGSSGGVGN
ncbi:hypothetical protein P692DRAFT_20221865 [Suillus brevipes Sb2]|nr:hypothetical protein P692DRAFT_20221865 [Suillus brevipes Sb2]